MRLLKICNVNGDDVDFELVSPEVIPQYAILSHTWGNDSDELSFEDLEYGTGHQKNGYQKVKNFLAKTWRAGLRYGWVDSCCIDKSCSTELSEAINSMFQWYKDAQHCCVYLVDFLEHPKELSNLKVAAKLRHCRWFTRGWTLQELLASSRLIFYAEAWQSIGEGEFLRDVISAITHIQVEALMNPNKLGDFSIAQRMSWASMRETTRPEDIAYCLMGIFDVNMPLLYGEGNKAFIRLQEHIARDSDDQTIFCWRREPVHGETQETTSSFWAASPCDYQYSSVYQPIRTGIAQPFAITNAGLRITGKLQDCDGIWGLFLHCYDKTMPHTFVKLPLKILGQDGDQFLRVPSRIEREFMDSPAPYFSATASPKEYRKRDLLEKTIYISKKATLPPLPRPLGHLVSFLLIRDVSLRRKIRIGRIYPPVQRENMSLILPTHIDLGSKSLTDFSWHAAINIRVVSKASEPSNVVAFVSYNGRQDEPWCELRSLEGDQHDLVTLWQDYGLSARKYRPPNQLRIISSNEKWVLLASIIMDPKYPESHAHKLVLEKLPEGGRSAFGSSSVLERQKKPTRISCNERLLSP